MVRSRELGGRDIARAGGAVVVADHAARRLERLDRVALRRALEGKLTFRTLAAHAADEDIDRRALLADEERGRRVLFCTAPLETHDEPDDRRIVGASVDIETK